MPARIDVHQHLWPDPLLRALSRRGEPPCVVRRRDGWAVRLAGEPEAPFDPADHDPDRRRALVRADGLDKALIALSTPLGIEALPAAEAEPLVAAFNDGVADLPAEFGAWGAIALDAPDPAAVSGLVDRAFVGLCLPADALADPVAYERVGPVLETL